MIFSNFHDAFFIPLTHIVQLILLEIFNQHSFYIHLFQIFLHLFIALQLYHLTSRVLKFDLLKSLLASLFYPASISGGMYSMVFIHRVSMLPFVYIIGH